MTEDDAKTKWCPYRAKVAAPNDGYDLCSCIASACMMWEPYKYWKDQNNNCFANELEGRILVEGGNCGLITKECEGCRL